MATHYFKIPPPEETEEKDKPVAEVLFTAVKLSEQLPCKRLLVTAA